MCRECHGHENEFSIDNGVLTIHKAYINGKPMRLEIAKTKPRSEYKYEVGDIISNDKVDFTIIDRVLGRVYGSKGYNAKYYIIMCNKCGCVMYKLEYHVDSNGCGVCGLRSDIVYIGYNDLATTHPHIAEQWYTTKNNDLLPTMVSYASHKKVWWLCNECGNEWKASIYNRSLGDTCCPHCGDGISYPNKVVALFVKSLGLDYKLEHTFDGYGQFRFDIYLPKHGKVIENDGCQHYAYLDEKLKDKKIWNDKTGMEIRYTDLGKESIVMNKGLELIPIDCRESNIDYIKNSIEQCEFFQQFDLSKIDWQEIDKQAQKSLKLNICRRWKKGKEVDNDFSTTDLIKEFGVSESAIRDYLKWGNDSGLCEYNPQEERQARYKRDSKFVYLIKPNGKKWFDKPMSQRELERQSGITVVTIGKYRQSSKPLKRDSRAKYDPKYIGSYIMTVEDYNLKYGSN